MKKRRLNRLLHAIQSVIAFDQPELSANIQDGNVIVEGSFIVAPTTAEHASSGAIAEFSILIVLDLSYPKNEPRVSALGNNIPQTPEHHINDDGSCCVVIWEEWFATSEDTSIQAYFDGPLKNYFLGQHLKLTTGNWTFNERNHGKEGIIDAFAEILGCAKNEKKIGYLLRILSKEWPRGHWVCPCNSGQIIRNCCATDLATLSKKVPSKVAKKMNARLRLYCRKRR